MAGRISLVVPCYNEQQAIPLFYAEACKAAEELRQRFSVEVEFVFVNDGSTDGTLGVLRGAGRRRTGGCAIFPCRGISARRRRCMRAWSMPPAIMWR